MLYPLGIVGIRLYAKQLLDMDMCMFCSVHWPLKNSSEEVGNIASNVFSTIQKYIHSVCAQRCLRQIQIATIDLITFANRFASCNTVVTGGRRRCVCVGERHGFL